MSCTLTEPCARTRLPAGHMPRRTFRPLALALSAVLASSLLPAVQAAPQKVVFLAGHLDAGHPAGTHEYEQAARLFAHYLQHSNVAEQLQVEIHFDGWPLDVQTLDEAATIVVISSGSDRNEADHPLLADGRWDVLRKQMDRGCGLILLHWATFLPDRLSEDALRWVGGYFDYQDGADGKTWYSRIETHTTLAEPGTPEHPICRGWQPFDLHEEYYFQLRFPQAAPFATPILVTQIPGVAEKQTVAWAVERTDGGRGFGFTGGHFFENWRIPELRQMVLNAIAWTAHVELPEQGVQPAAPAESMSDTDEPYRAVIVTGHQYPGHPWRETTLALEDALRRDERLEVVSIPDPEFLADPKLKDFDLVVFNYCNWQRPGLSEAAKAGFVDYVRSGGGLILIHFSNGAFHFSLPEAGESDWPEYRHLCRRVWDHTPGKSGHDAYGPFRVDVAPLDHPITRGLASFETTDELYYRQQGDEPIEVLATARSRDTGHDEPLAFVYEYGAGRVFQTVLGHDAPALAAPGTAELVRRAAAWVAHRTQRDLPLPVPPPPPPVEHEGFGAALEASAKPLVAAGNSEYAAWPLTVSCWARLLRKDGFNILVAQQVKESAEHWELYSYAGSGEFSVYLPGCEPAELRSGVAIVDEAWHHVAFVCDGSQAELFVDGKLAREFAIRRVGQGPPAGDLWIGAYPPQGIGCAGQVDEVLLQRGLHRPSEVPAVPAVADEDTLALYHLDEAPDATEYADDSALANVALPVRAAAAAPIPAQQSQNDHFEGFQEADVVDDRANEVQSGPFHAATIRTPRGITLKGLAVRLGDSHEATLLYDLELLAPRAAWQGGFLRHSPARFALIEPPAAAGDVAWELPALPGWSYRGSWADPRPGGRGPLPREWTAYRGLHVHGDRVVLEYDVQGVRVLESPWWEPHGESGFLSRTFEVDAGPSLELVAGPGGALAALVGDAVGCTLVAADGQPAILQLPARRERLRVKLLCAAAPMDAQTLAAHAAQSTPAEDLTTLVSPGPRRWQATLVTQLERAADDEPYVIDTLALPHDNPWGALLFLSGIDFLSNGDAVVCAVHGDVWRVSGIDDPQGRLAWQRIATGLFQPLGLKIVDDQIYVLGRDQLTRLHDLNSDGETDFYECFNNQGQITANGHEYATCLETDAEGNFYYVRGDSGGATDHDGCLLRVTPDGQTLSVFATGFRNANGLGIGPDGTITVAPQEGNWTPASCICAVREGGFYGVQSVHHRPQPPTDYDPPLCWIPRPFDNSSGGQVWCPGEGFGPLSGQLLHASFGRCSLLLVLHEEVAGVRQGGVLPLWGPFLSGVVRGRFRPQDGQLYVVGTNGWVTSAARDGCLQRVRYTGQSACLPVGLRVLANGLALTFSEPLAPDAAEDVERYRVERWNYRRSADYGSEDWSVAEPNRVGHDPVEVLSATLSEDGCTVLLELADLKPVMQQQVHFALRSARGTPVRHTLAHTIHVLGSERIVPGPRPPAPPPIVAPEVAARLAPGWLLAWRDLFGFDRGADRVLQRAAWQLPSADAPAGVRAQLGGFVQAELRGEYSFRCLGSGRVQLSVNGQTLARWDGDLAAGEPARVLLRKGYNRIDLEYWSDSGRDAQLRLYWSGEEFPWEPLPPTALLHDPLTPPLANPLPLEQGGQLLAVHRCTRCHAPPEQLVHGLFDFGGPDLAGLGRRVSRPWLQAWLLDPQALQPHATMPTLLHDPARAPQQAADLAAFLRASATEERVSDVEAAGDAADDAELVEHGELLYETLGCIACHALQASDEPDPWQRRSLVGIRQKFLPGALAEFLRQPQAHHAFTRMPDFRLTNDDSTALAAYLQSEADPWEGLSTDFPEGDAESGRQLFAQFRCGQCHALQTGQPVPPPTLAWPDVRRLPNGCLADRDELLADVAKLPDYRLDEATRDALCIALSDVGIVREPAARAAFLLDRLNCQACHARDAQPALLPEVCSIDGALGLPPEIVPSLTWAGEKLQADWVRRLLAGDLNYRARPWLRARMPAFPAYAEELSTGLAALQGLPAQREAEPALDAGLVQVGEQLMLKERGLDCRRCHAQSDAPISIEHNAQGVGISRIAERLRPEFYARWMHDPLRIDPATKMPRFAPLGRTTAIEFYGGDAQQQFDALWQYLRSQTASRDE